MQLDPHGYHGAVLANFEVRAPTKKSEKTFVHLVFVQRKRLGGIGKRGHVNRGMVRVYDQPPAEMQGSIPRLRKHGSHELEADLLKTS